jgi:tetratricopeptide (TPR) repeat protein
MGAFGKVFVHEVLIPLALPATLLALALVLRLARISWFRYKQAGFPPVLIRAADDAESAAFAARLSAYLAQDTPGADIVIPPGGRGGESAYPVGGLNNTAGWLSMAIRIVLAAERVFEVHVESGAIDLAGKAAHRAIVRTTRTPGNRVVAAATIEEESERELVHRAGCLIIHSIRQTRSVLRHTPRWERWSPELKGYLEYRDALDHERRGRRAYTRALSKYNEAVHNEPGNFVISMRKAALLEVMGKYGQAAQVYRACHELWPENIEAAYRLAAAHSNSRDYAEAREVLIRLRRTLRRRSVWFAWARTLMKRRSAGEQRYWRDLLRRRPIIFGTSKRALFANAVRVAMAAREIDELTLGYPNNSLAADPLKEVAKLVTRREYSKPHIRLFHPDQRSKYARAEHDHSLHNRDRDVNFAMYPFIQHARPKSRLGWLAHYNAAIFFSLALGLGTDKLPPGYSGEDWQVDCARAAIFELGYVKRDPRSELEADWYRTDPGLQRLREYSETHGTHWSGFVGLEKSSRLRRIVRWIRGRGI